MNNRIDRRTFAISTAGLAGGMVLAHLGNRPLSAAPTDKGAPNAEKLGWRLGCQAYSFRKFTFYEAVEKITSLGLHYVEMFPKQRLSAEKPESVVTNESMPPEDRAEIKARLARAQVKLVNYGVCRLPDDEAQCRATFEFAKDMGIETLVSEPPFEALKMLDTLAGQFGINVAIHNHPKPSAYWNPDTVLEHCNGLSHRVGACADTGHWMRSGVDPLEAIRKLEGRIISFHFKDLNEFGRRDAHDVPWGTGKANVEALLTEIHRQGIKAVFSIEYEHNWENSLPEIAQSVAYFDKLASQWT